MARPAQYIELADRLEERWSALAPGTLVESEHQLAAEFGVNRLTAREAVREMERRMAVRRVMGRGTFTAFRVDYRIRLGEVASFHRTVAEVGHEPSVEVTRRRWLGRAATRRLVIDRIGLVDGFVATAVTETFPSEVGQLVGDAVGAGGSVHEALEAAGHVPRRRSVLVAMEIPEPPLAEALGYGPAVPPTWRVQSVTVDRESGAEIHRSDSWMRTDMFAVAVELDDLAR
mgnify:CR=1 FL=1